MVASALNWISRGFRYSSVRRMRDHWDLRGYDCKSPPQKGNRMLVVWLMKRGNLACKGNVLPSHSVGFVSDLATPRNP